MTSERLLQLEAEIRASDIAIAEYRQQCLDNAAEIARLRAESEERLQNCAALIAENEQLRKDAERYQWLRDEWIDYKPAGYDGRNVGRFDLVLDHSTCDLDAAIDAAMKGTS